MFTPEQGFFVKCMTKWLTIREEQGHDISPQASQLKADIDHSALLKRLLSGKEPLPLPPPHSFNQPWYSLIEEGRADKVNAFIYENYQGLPLPTAVIDGFPWTLVERLSDSAFLVSYNEQASLYRLQEERPEDNFGWSIEVVPTPSP